MNPPTLWFGRRSRGSRHDIPELVPAPAVAELPRPRLQAGARYLGTTLSGDRPDRVVARGLGPRSTARLSLSDEGLDVIRLAGSFRIPAGSLRGARHDRGTAGKVVPPRGLLVVTWEHGDHLLDTGFRLTADRLDHGASAGTTGAHNVWVRSVAKIAREHTA